MEKLIILGSGPAALTAAIYTSRAQLNPLVIQGRKLGGQLMSTSYVENWPGEKSILGPKLMMNMMDHAKAFGARFISGDATHAVLTQKPFSITVEKKDTYETQVLIVATGAEPKKLQCPGEQDYWGKGVTTCAVCDGMFYKDKPVIIVGGGDTAMENASFMLNYTQDITIVQIEPELTASPAMQERIKNRPEITVYYNSTVTKIEGDGEKVKSATITNKKTHEDTSIGTAAVFISIGYNPNTGLFKDQLALNSYGYLKLTDHTKTSIPGVFGAGDVSDPRYRQAITAAGAGCMAALDAEKYLSELSV